MKTGTIVALAVAGVAVGLLFGTKKGAAIRGDIADKANELKNKLGRASRDAMDEVADLKEAVSRKVKGLSDDARKRVVEVLDEGTNGVERMKAKVKPGNA
jgi:gas vesicle protein